MATETEPFDRVAHNLRLMKKGDEAFNRQDAAGMEAAHRHDLIAHIMGSNEPIHGQEAHGLAMQGLFRAFPDIKVEDDYAIQFGVDAWTTVINRVTGTFTGELVQPDGTTISGTGKSFDVALTTTARWEGDQMAEEWVFWDSALMAQQIGLA